MAAHARPFAGGVIAETVLAEDVVLRARDVGGRGARPHGGKPCFERLAKYREGPPLRLACLPGHERAADLHEISFERRSELCRDEIADANWALRRGRHPQHVLAAGADDHEI